MKANIEIPLVPASRATFEPYGYVVQAGLSGLPVNDGTARRHDIDIFPAEKADQSLSLVTSVFEVDGLALPRTIRMLERHPRTAQLIVPISALEHVVVVCLSTGDGVPDISTLGAFYLTGEQGA